MRLVWRVVAPVMCLLLAALLRPSAAVAQNGATVTVVVRDSVTRAAVSDATVDLRSEKVTRASRTQNDGLVQFADLSPETYAISIVRIGYRPRVTTVMVGAADVTAEEFVEALPTAIVFAFARSGQKRRQCAGVCVECNAVSRTMAWVQLGAGIERRVAALHGFANERAVAFAGSCCEGAGGAARQRLCVSQRSAHARLPPRQFEIDEVAFAEVYPASRSKTASAAAREATTCSGSVFLWTRK